MIEWVVFYSFTKNIHVHVCIVFLYRYRQMRQVFIMLQKALDKKKYNVKMELIISKHQTCSEKGDK